MSRKILLRISIIILFHIQLIKNKYKRISNSFYNSAYYYKYNTAIGGPGLSCTRRFLIFCLYSNLPYLSVCSSFSFTTTIQNRIRLLIVLFNYSIISIIHMGGGDSDRGAELDYSCNLWGDSGIFNTLYSTLANLLI